MVSTPRSSVPAMVYENRKLKTLGSWNRPVFAEKAYRRKEPFEAPKSILRLLLVDQPA